MQAFRRQLWIALVPGLGAVLGLCAAGLGPWLPLPTVARLALAVSGLVVAGGTVAVSVLASLRRQDLVSRWLNHLERISRDGLSPDETPELPRIYHPLPWRPALARVQQIVLETLERCRNAELIRAALEVRLRRQEAQQQRTNSILSTLAEPVLAVDAFNQLVLTNSSAEELFHLPPGCVEQRATAQLLHCEQLLKLLDDVGQRPGAPRRTIEVEIADEAGQAHPYRVTAANISYGGGRGNAPAETLGAVAVLRDVSEERAAQRRHAEFVSAVSHEMKTPLASIKAYVELLVDGDAEDEATQEEFLTVINSQAERLQRLIDNLLNLARIEAGVTRVDKQERSLNDILAEAERVIQPAAERRRIRLVSELSSLYLGVYGDRDTLLQAAINLLSNAVKYTPEGGTVTLKSRTADERLCFEVTDTGVGLSPEDRLRVFEKFYRVRKDRDMAPGTGLGLPLVKHIIEDIHGGEITVESELGRGSTFRVLLPAAGQLVER